MSTAPRKVRVIEPRAVLSGRFQGEFQAASEGELSLRLPISMLDRAAAEVLGSGGRFVTVFQTRLPEPALVAVFALHGELVSLWAPLEGHASYASLTRATPASDWRELALTRLNPAGSRRGTADARVTLYAREATRQPRTAGNSQTDLVATASASTHHSKARVAKVVPMAQRRPCRNRSSNGPISGAITVNGAIVSSRNRATCPRASPVGMLKIVPASDSVNAVSPALWTAFSSTRRASPDSPAPPECVKTLNRRALARPPRPTSRALA